MYALSDNVVVAVLSFDAHRHPRTLKIAKTLIKYGFKVKVWGFRRSVKEKHRVRLTLIADNLANYFRTILKEKPKKFREELEKFEK